MSIGAAIVLSGWGYASACRLGDTTQAGIGIGRRIGWMLTTIGIAVDIGLKTVNL